MNERRVDEQRQDGKEGWQQRIDATLTRPSTGDTQRRMGVGKAREGGPVLGSLVQSRSSQAAKHVLAHNSLAQLRNSFPGLLALTIADSRAYK